MSKHIANSAEVQSELGAYWLTTGDAQLRIVLADLNAASGNVAASVENLENLKR